MKLSPRDKRLLELLAKYEVLSSKLIRVEVFPNVIETNFFRRLRELENDRYIRRIGPMPDHSYAWVLGPLGRDLYGVFAFEAQKNRVTIEHDMALAEVRMRMEDLGLAKHLVPESELRREALSKKESHQEQGKGQIVPDALFPVMMAESAVIFALEVELSLKNRRRYQELFFRYYGTHFVKSIWYLTKTIELGRKVETEFYRFYQRNSRNYQPFQRFGFTVLGEFLKSPRNCLVHRQGHRQSFGEEILDWFYLRAPENHCQVLDQSRDQSLIGGEVKKSVGT
jgi:hypothetical protein